MTCTTIRNASLEQRAAEIADEMPNAKPAPIIRARLEVAGYEIDHDGRTVYVAVDVAENTLRSHIEAERYIRGVFPEIRIVWRDPQTDKTWDQLPTRSQIHQARHI